MNAPPLVMLDHWKNRIPVAKNLITGKDLTSAT